MGPSGGSRAGFGLEGVGYSRRGILGFESAGFPARQCHTSSVKAPGPRTAAPCAAQDGPRRHQTARSNRDAWHTTERSYVRAVRHSTMLGPGVPRRGFGPGERQPRRRAPGAGSPIRRWRNWQPTEGPGDAARVFAGNDAPTVDVGGGRRRPLLALYALARDVEGSGVLGPAPLRFDPMAVDRAP